MRQDKITKDILMLLNNNHTEIKESEDIAANYYNFVTDTIYLSIKQNKSKQVKGLENANPFCGNLITICHECIHSVQNKWLHILNLLLSNFSLIITICAMYLMLISSKPVWFVITGACFILCAMVCRLFLEVEAINKSIALAENALREYDIENVGANDIQEARNIIKRLVPVQLMKMLLDKIIMFVIIVI